MKNLILVSLSFFIIGSLSYFAYFNFFTKSNTISGNYEQKVKGFKTSDGRTNFLIVGVDTREKIYDQSGTLTDTLIVASLDSVNKDVKMLSIPRDLWVDYQGYQGKINGIYNQKGIGFLTEVVESTVGVKIPYNLEVNFKGFRDVIDIVEGVTVNNAKSFTDFYYPLFGKENDTCGLNVEDLLQIKIKQAKKNYESINENNEDALPFEEGVVKLDSFDFKCRYETIKFEEGEIKLNGKDALKYARSRHSADPEIGNDFNRAKRQQTVIKSIIAKIFSLDTLTSKDKIIDLYNLATNSIKTNLSIVEIIGVYAKNPNIKNLKITQAVLSPKGFLSNGEGVLVEGNSLQYGGAYVLIPADKAAITNFANNYFYASTVEKLELETGIPAKQ